MLNSKYNNSSPDTQMKFLWLCQIICNENCLTNKIKVLQCINQGINQWLTKVQTFQILSNYWYAFDRVDND